MEKQTIRKCANCGLSEDKHPTRYIVGLGKCKEFITDNHTRKRGVK